MCLGRGNASVKLYDINGKLRDVVLDNALYIPAQVSALKRKGNILRHTMVQCLGYNKKGVCTIKIVCHLQRITRAL